MPRISASAALFCSGLVALFSPGIRAQQTVTPTTANLVDASSLLHAPGFTEPARQQILIEAHHLGGVSGKALLHLSFRRDTGTAATAAALTGGQTNLQIRLSTSRRPATNPSSRFADNTGTDVATVFSGLVTIPASPAVTTSTAVVWDPQHTVRISLGPGYVYSGGTLCIDISGDPRGLGSPWWPVDAVSDRLKGASVSVGNACGPYGAPGIRTAAVQRDSLVVGNTARFSLRGEPAATAFLVFARRAVKNAIPIDPSRDAWIHLDGILGTARTQLGPARAPGRPFIGAEAGMLVPIPPMPSLLAAEFAVQWITLSGTTVSTSDAIACKLADRLPSLGMAVVMRSGANPTTGIVQTDVAPVLRLEY